MIKRGFLTVQPRCGYCPLNKSPRVLPEGNLAADVAIVGEGAGIQEEHACRPFVGDSGELLNWFLRHVGITNRMHHVWLTNAGICRPKAVEYGPEWVSETESKIRSVEACRERLLYEIGEVQPRVVLALGALALQSLTGKNGIIARHGGLHYADFPILGKKETHSAIVIPALHPAHLLRGEDRKTRGVLEVFKKAFRIARAGPQPDITRVLITPAVSGGPEVAVHAFEQIVDTILAAHDIEDLAIDVETNSADALEAKLTVCGFGVPPCYAWSNGMGVAVSILAYNRATGGYQPCWSRAHAARLIAAMIKLFSSRLRKWLWNMNFDCVVIDRVFPGKLKGPFADGIHYHWLEQPDAPHPLSWAVQSLTDAPAWKADFHQAQDAGESTDYDRLDYNARDAGYTAKVIPVLTANVLRVKNEHLINHQVRVTQLARKAFEHGIPINVEERQKVVDELTTKQTAALELMQAQVKGSLPDLNAYIKAEAEHRGAKSKPKLVKELVEFNPRSPYHAGWLLYQKLKVPLEQWTSGGVEKDPRKRRPRTSYKAVLDYMENPVIKAFVDYGELSYHLSRVRTDFTEKVSNDGRLHSSINVTGTAGTRWVYRPNCQNLDKTLKRILTAPEGYLWVGADAAQLEMRILACFANLPKFLTIFNRPAYNEDDPNEAWKKLDPEWDSHSLVAYMVYGDAYLDPPVLEEEKKKARTNYRTLVKRVVYGMNYGAYPKKIRSALLDDKRLPLELRRKLTIERVTEIFEGFHNYFPQVNQWAEAEMSKVQRYGYQIIPPFHRRRPWPIRGTDLEAPKLRNTPIQLAAGDIVNVLFCRMDDEVSKRGLDATMAIHAHDACYWLTREAQAPAMIELINRHFHFNLEHQGRTVRIWGSASAHKNPAKVA